MEVAVSIKDIFAVIPILLIPKNGNISEHIHKKIETQAYIKGIIIGFFTMEVRTSPQLVQQTLSPSSILSTNEILSQ